MNKSAALPMQHADHAERRGLLLGLIGVAIFSQTLPFTRMAVAELDATFVALRKSEVLRMARVWKLLGMI